MPIDYSRFDAIDTSSSEEEGSPLNLLPSQPTLPPSDGSNAPPANVMDDLEDYFERLDARRVEAARAQEAPSIPSVERMTETEIEMLDRVQGPGLRGNDFECAICILGVTEQDECFELPCAARHRFHVDCARSWLSRNVSCPLCRVDVRNLIRARAAAEEGPGTPPHDGGSSSPRESELMSPRSSGYTRDGGVIARYEPRPPPELSRPAYIPPHLREVAELVEICYPNRGTARIWRVPR